MKLYYYIHKCDDTDKLVFTTSCKKITMESQCIELSQAETQEYSLHIKYIDCCELDKNSKLVSDPVLVLAQRLECLTIGIHRRILELRKLIVEASALNNTDVIQEIIQTITALDDFINEDFSSIKTIKEIDTLTCPELDIDFPQHYASKIYRIRHTQ